MDLLRFLITTNKGTAVEQGIIDDFFTIVDTAIANDNMSHATRTVATNPSCANVISAIKPSSTPLQQR